MICRVWLWERLIVTRVKAGFEALHERCLLLEHCAGEPGLGNSPALALQQGLGSLLW